MSHRPAGGYNVFASACARSHLDAIENGIQFRLAVHAQTSELLDQRIKDLSARSVQQTDHVQIPNSPTGVGASRIACGALLRRAFPIPAGTIAALADDHADGAVETARRCRASFSLRKADPVAESSPDTRRRALPHCPD